MSLSDRRSFLFLLAAAPLAACGFTPVYAPGGAGDALRGRVEVDAPVNRMEFEMVSRLEERLGRGSAPADIRYALSHRTTVGSRGIAVTGANDITRVRLNGETRYALRDIESGDILIEGTVTNFTAYTTTSTTLATAAGQRDAEDRLMIALADQVVARLLAGMGQPS